MKYLMWIEATFLFLGLLAAFLLPIVVSLLILNDSMHQDYPNNESIFDKLFKERADGQG